MPSPRHAAAQTRAVWPPEPGLFSMTLVRGGWKVPARIARDADGAWVAEVNGETCAAHPDPAYAHGVASIWANGLKIDEATYNYLSATREWARLHDPAHPALHPDTPINRLTVRPLT